ncbi:MAG: nitroreductase family protein [Eubacteriales bacterium]|nr:nitroreductase family protein [Eubacteriales bacterium]
MTFSEVLEKRYSVRKFSDRPVEKEKLQRILEAGRLAPTGVNWQPQRLLVLEGEGMEKFAKCTFFIFGAQLGIMVCYDENVSWTSDWGRSTGCIDASMVLANMMYAAEEQGLGTIIIGGYNEDRMRELFKIPDYLIPIGVLLTGYPAEDSRPHPTLHQRKPLEDTVFYGDYSGVVPGEDHRGQHRVKFPD